MAINKPKQPEIIPFNIDPSEITMIAIKPVMANAVNSGGEKLLANFARVGAASINTMPPKRPPKADAEIAIPIASEARPF